MKGTMTIMGNPNTNKISAINLTSETSPEALEIVNILAAEDDRSGVNTVERLIAQAGKARAERIKAKTIKQDSQ